MELEASDDSEEGHQQLRKFFDDYTNEVRIVNTKLINQKGLKKATQDKSSLNSKVKHKDFKNRCIHLTRIPFENRVLVLRPNTYVIDRQPFDSQVEEQPTRGSPPTHPSLEGARHAKWPACKIEDVDIDEYKFSKMDLGSEIAENLSGEPQHRLNPEGPLHLARLL